MRSQKSSKKVKLLPKIVNDINSTENQGIGMLVPRSVQGRDGDIIIKGLFLVLALISTSFEIPAVFDYSKKCGNFKTGW